MSRQYRILVERNKALEADRVKEEERERRRSSFNRLESIAEEPGCSMLSSLEKEHRRDRERQASHRSQRIEHGFESNCQRLRTTKDNVKPTQPKGQHGGELGGGMACTDNLFKH